jgi:hypothetical protein
MFNISSAASVLMLVILSAADAAAIIILNYYYTNGTAWFFSVFFWVLVIRLPNFWDVWRTVCGPGGGRPGPLFFSSPKVWESELQKPPQGWELDPERNLSKKTGSPNRLGVVPPKMIGGNGSRRI